MSDAERRMEEELRPMARHVIAEWRVRGKTDAEIRKIMVDDAMEILNNAEPGLYDPSEVTANKAVLPRLVDEELARNPDELSEAVVRLFNKFFVPDAEG